MLSGSYIDHDGLRRRDRNPALVFCHPAGEAHASQFAGAAVRILRVEIDPGRFALRERFEVYSHHLSELTSRLHAELVQADELSPLAIEGLSLELLASMARARTPAHRGAPAWLGRVRDLLRARFAEKWSLEGVAAVAGVHPVYLASEFRRRTGTTIGGYVRRLRIEFAQHALVQSDTPLAEIALAAGFSSQSHLTTAFRRTTGITPGAFRNSLRDRR